jgi:hypothetical protein
MLIPPPPLNDIVLPAPESRSEIVTFLAGPVTCDGETVSPIRIERPFASSMRRFGPVAGTPAPTWTVSFSIDGDGRPVDISAGESSSPGFFVDVGDLEPSLAASRFLPAHPHRKCSIRYGATLTPVAEAPQQLLYEVASAPVPGGADSEIYDRIREEGDCARGPSNARRINYPDFESIAQPPGTRSWSFLSYDVDAHGRVDHVHVLASSGNAALDRGGTKALSRNRYASGRALHGCTYRFYRLAGTPVSAPAMPADAPADNGEIPACSIDPKTISTLLNGNAYPAAEAVRRVEGYAIVGYDTAPWGAIGNVHVIASEPDHAFGQAARNALFSANVRPNDVGHTGCVRRVVFRVPRERPGG